jgi:glycerol-3-phosphate dehydrogenase
MLADKRCRTKTTKLRGATGDNVAEEGSLSRYGSDAQQVKSLFSENPALAATIDKALPFTLAEVVYAVRHEMARTVEDVLSRRTRALLLDAEAARRAAPAVARTMAAELGASSEWVEQQVAAFDRLARTFYVEQSTPLKS